MIGFFGFRGSGKTRAVVAQIYKDWNRNPNLIVFSNTPLNFGKHKKTKTELNLFIWNNFEDLKTFFEYALISDNVEKFETIILIDEANLVMPSRLFAKLPPFVLAFLAESRKLGVEIYFTTQHPIRVDKILRELTETWVKCRSFLSLLTIKKHTFLSTSGEIKEDLYQTFLLFPFRFHKKYDTYHIVGIDKSLVQEDKQAAKNKNFLKFIEKNYSEKNIKKRFSFFSRFFGKKSEGKKKIIYKFSRIFSKLRNIKLNKFILKFRKKQNHESTK